MRSGAVERCKTPGCIHTREEHSEGRGPCFPRAEVECDCELFRSVAPERSEGPSEANGADAVVSATLGPVFFRQLVDAGREGRRLTLEAPDCRAVVELGKLYAARFEGYVTACRELEGERRAVARLREEIVAANAARDEALMQASEAAERAHRAEGQRDAANERIAAAEDELSMARERAAEDTAVMARALGTRHGRVVAGLEGVAEALKDRAEAAERRAAEMECDRDQALADRAQAEEAHDLLRTVTDLRAEVATLQADRTRLAQRWGAAKRDGDLRAKVVDALWQERFKALRIRNKLLTHQRREVERLVALIGDQRGPLFIHTRACWQSYGRDCHNDCGGRWVE